MWALKIVEPGYPISAWINIVRKFGIMPGHVEKINCKVTVFMILVVNIHHMLSVF
jgi:hypothetical protein